ncbi:MAG: hypothetical protein IKS00_05340 [Bacteroidales bacterium]|nr:hypothetical protein [Bacteroidales bacterium]
MHKTDSTYRTLIFAVISAAILSACVVKNEVKPDSSVEWDSISMKIYFTDTNGYDLLDTSQTFYAGSQITILHHGKKYKINYPPPEDSTKKFKYEELLLEQCEDSARYCINFGKFDGSKSYDEDIIISWRLKKATANMPKNVQDIIHLRHIVYKDKAQTRWSFNGVELDNDSTFAAFCIKKIVK